MAIPIEIVPKIFMVLSSLTTSETLISGSLSSLRTLGLGLTFVFKLLAIRTQNNCVNYKTKFFI